MTISNNIPIIFELESPIIFISLIDDIIIDSSLEDQNNYLVREVSYTVDGINWSEFSDQIQSTISDINLSIKNNHYFDIKYRITKVGDNNLDLYSINLNYTFSGYNVSEQFNNSFYKGIIEEKSPKSINLLINLLNKFFKSGITPKYIERSENSDWVDEDYILLFSILIDLYSKQSEVTENIKNLIFDSSYLDSFIKQRGLNTHPYKDIQELRSISQNIYNEYAKRGSKAIFENKGEFLRLIGKFYNQDSYNGDLTHAVFLNKTFGNWCINKSSPCFKGLNNVYDANLSEKQLNIYSLDNFILGNFNANNTAEILETDENNNFEGCKFSVININKNASNSVTESTIKSQNIHIDSNLNYEFSFYVKKVSEGLASAIGVNFEAFCEIKDSSNFEKFENSGSTISLVLDDQPSDKWIKITTYFLSYRNPLFNLSNDIIEDELPYASGIFRFTSKSIKNFNYKLTVVGGGGTNTQIWGISLKPIKTDFSRYYINNINQSIIFFKNRSTQTDEKIYEECVENLLPYNNINNNINI